MPAWLFITMIPIAVAIVGAVAFIKFAGSDEREH